MKKYLFILSVILFSCDRDPYNEVNLRSVLGVNVEIKKKILYDDSWSGIQGEGFTIYGYELSEETIERFINNKEKSFFSQSLQDQDWKSYGWESTPVKNEYEEISNMLTTYWNGHSKQQAIVNKIKPILNNVGSYYAFRSKGGIEYPSFVKFFLINPTEKMLYVFEVNV